MEIPNEVSGTTNEYSGGVLEHRGHFRGRRLLGGTSGGSGGGGLGDVLVDGGVDRLGVAASLVDQRLAVIKPNEFDDQVDALVHADLGEMFFNDLGIVSELGMGYQTCELGHRNQVKTAVMGLGVL